MFSLYRFSTYEEKTQNWPMDTKKKIPKGKGFVTSDFFSTDFGSIIEQLFVTSDGFAVLLNEFDSWFLRRDPNGGDPLLCVAVDHNHFPYHRYYKEDYFHIEFRIMAARNVREAHQTVMKQPGWIPKPTSIPDANLFTSPIWSTWAVYHKEINQSTVLEFAQQVKKHDFPVAQIEIDDLWEKHYGDFTFDVAKFPNATKLVEDIRALGYPTTLWVYPFVNSDSAAFNESAPHLTRNSKGQLAGVTWWDGVGGIIDFSTLSAADWFVGRLKKLQAETKIHSFKFDAGEVGWYGSDFNFTDSFVGENPSLMTLRYVFACARMGGSIEVRSAYRTQNVPVFVRMLDKNSHWGLDNGLKSLITTALTMSLGGYSFILPDMIGGNAYGRHPSEELYIRWVQANALLPAMQFSIPPWAYSQSTVNLTKRFLELHKHHSATFIALAKRVQHGEPIIRPMWYAAPEDARSFTIADQFMVGEDLLVAPVVEENQRQRSVFFPSGTWVDQHGKSYNGLSVATVLAPLEELPYFTRKH